MPHTGDRLAERDLLRGRLADLDASIEAEASFGRDLTDSMRQATGRAPIERPAAPEADAPPVPEYIPMVGGIRLPAGTRVGQWGGAEGGPGAEPAPGMGALIRDAWNRRS